jgi:prepilin-type processing-associated H-X9-DG protein
MASSENFTTYGFSSKMGPLLRHTVEQQLRADLCHYGVPHTGLQFDWSASCLEGKDAAWLDGHVENFSSIALLDQKGQTIAEGWMEFILVDGQLIVYWDNLTSWDTLGKHLHKAQFGIPQHIWNMIPENVQHLHQQDRMNVGPKIP